MGEEGKMEYNSLIYRDRGSLKYIGYKPLGRFAKYHYYRCKHCGTDYPVIDGRIMCNGVEVFDCPLEAARLDGEGDFTQAKGVLPMKEGDELPEVRIRRSRG